MRYANEGHQRTKERDEVADQVTDFWIWFDERMQEREELERQLPEPRIDADPIELTQLIGDEDIIWE